ncbi:MAG: phospholipase D-like domain-containing protein, partial [Paraclostridium sp.]
MVALDIILLSYVIISYIAGIIVSINIILQNRDPAKTMAWLLIFILLPGVGLVIYAVLGRNIRKRKIFKTQRLATNIKENNLFKNMESIEELVELEQRAINDNNLIKDEYYEGIKKKVISLLLNTGKFPFTTNNNVKVFIDGNEKFESLLKDIEQAKEHIHLEYFIIKNSDIGIKLKELLIKKANEGVSIKILYDDVGCWRFWFHRKFFQDMKDEGIEIVPFLPAKFPIIGGKINYRNHRKIAIIDGHIGYTGGINIGDEYMGKNKKFGYWRDTHVRIE